MHPFDCFFRGGQVIHAVGLLEILFGPLCGLARLPLATILDQRDTVSAALIPFSYEDSFTFACDEDVLFLENRYSIFGEHGDVAVVRYFANAQE